MTLLIDTSVWFAAANEKDRSNRRAKQLLAAETGFVTTDHVVVECWLLMNSRIGRTAAERFLEGLRDGAARLELITLGDIEAAWKIGVAFADQSFSFVDRTSFAVMERLSLLRVATFDDDFAIYRFGRNRDRAFEVVR